MGQSLNIFPNIKMFIEFNDQTMDIVVTCKCIPVIRELSLSKKAIHWLVNELTKTLTSAKMFHYCRGLWSHGVTTGTSMMSHTVWTTQIAKTSGQHVISMLISGSLLIENQGFHHPYYHSWATNSVTTANLWCHTWTTSNDTHGQPAMTHMDNQQWHTWTTSNDTHGQPAMTHMDNQQWHTWTTSNDTHGQPAMTHMDNQQWHTWTTSNDTHGQPAMTHMDNQQWHTWTTSNDTHGQPAMTHIDNQCCHNWETNGSPTG